MKQTSALLVTLAITASCTIREYYTYPPDAPIGDDEDAPLDDGGGGPDASDACLAAGGQIVFTTDRDGDTEIALMLADGSGFQQLTSNSWADELPVLSPDGSKIAWLSHGSGQPQLFVMNRDGSDVRSNISGGVVAAQAPRWSPDGDIILFTKTADVFRVAPDGTGLANLTNDPGSDQSADWSPDGSRIVFHSNRRDNGGTGFTESDLFVMDADGTDALPITPGGNNLGWGTPRWSPNGSTIVSGRTTSPTLITQLWQLSPTGTNIEQVFDGFGVPEWSPGSDRVVFSYSGDILSVVPGVSGSTNLTVDPSMDSAPRWDPSGAWIVFRTDRDGNQEVYSMQSDGATPTNLTNDAGADVPGSWGPCS